LRSTGSQQQQSDRANPPCVSGPAGLFCGMAKACFESLCRQAKYNQLMQRMAAVLIFSVLAWSAVLAQQTSEPEQASPGANQPLPRSSAPPRSVNESSSRETIIDLSPPADDAKDHPESAVDDEDEDRSDVKEFHPFDPHKAEKDVEVGDFYFKRGNLRAATERYREALEYKPNDAAATIGLAESLEKLGNKDEAAANYESYLKILPNGPRAEEARKGLERLKPKEAAGKR
jgi:tetratricopeptide (TPR) repeat protein